MLPFDKFLRLNNNRTDWEDFHHCVVCTVSKKKREDLTCDKNSRMQYFTRFFLCVWCFSWRQIGVLSRRKRRRKNFSREYKWHKIVKQKKKKCFWLVIYALDLWGQNVGPTTWTSGLTKWGGRSANGSKNSPTLSSVTEKTGLKFVGTIMQPDEKEKIELNPWHKQGSYKQQKSLKSNMASTSAGWNFEFWRQNHRPATQNVGWKFSLLFILIFFGLYKSAESGRSFYITQGVPS